MPDHDTPVRLPQHAPPGHVYVCGACGKRSRDMYGDQALDRGWDSSCFMNATIVTEAEAEEIHEKIRQAYRDRAKPMFP